MKEFIKCICKKCGKEFISKKNSQWCKDCVKTNTHCFYCGSELETPRAFCSYSCASKWRLENLGNPASRPEVIAKIAESKKPFFSELKVKRDKKKIEWEKGRGARKEAGIAKWKETRKKNNKPVALQDPVRKTEIINKIKSKYGGIGLSSPEIREKAKKTNLSRYGDVNPAKNKDVRALISQKVSECCKDSNFIEKRVNKYKETCDLRRGGTIEEIRERKEFEKYGKIGLSASEKVSYTLKLGHSLGKYKEQNLANSIRSRNNARDRVSKSRATCLERYGVDHPSKTAEFQNRVMATCIKKYGVSCVFLSKDHRPYQLNSKPSLYFRSLLDKYNISYESEFNLGKYSFDYKINNFLIEINPTSTHNLDFGVRHPKTLNYHRDKSNLAIVKGYNVFCVWDWIDYEEFVKWLSSRLNSRFNQTVVEGDSEVILVDFKNKKVRLATDGQPFYLDLEEV